MTNVSPTLKTVAICETQPVTIEGLRSLLGQCQDMEMIGSATSLFGGLELVRNKMPSVIVIDKAFGLPAIMDWMNSLRAGTWPDSARGTN